MELCSILNSVLPWMHFHGFSLFLKEFNCVQIPGTWANFQILHPTPTVLALRNGLPSYKFLIKSRTFWTHRNGPAFQTYTYPNYQNVHTVIVSNNRNRKFPSLFPTNLYTFQTESLLFFRNDWDIVTFGGCIVVWFVFPTVWTYLNFKVFVFVLFLLRLPKDIYISNSSDISVRAFVCVEVELNFDAVPSVYVVITDWLFYY